jgi:glyoxylase-like metal-dependent hydrolase (beta-lactamase superfamily II)
MSSALNIEGFALGDWMTNCYVVWPEGGRQCWIVDAGFDPQPLIRLIHERDLEPAMLVLTHAHVDHIAGIDVLRSIWPALPIAIHEAEREFLGSPQLNLSIVLEEPIEAPEATMLLVNGQRLGLGGFEFEVRHTPGHSPGGICLYNAQEKVALVGDTLFRDSIGRYDFPTSDGRLLFGSIRQQLLTLPDETRVLPGHGPETTIGRERRSNPFL